MRLSKIITKTGDDGTTGLVKGRVDKDSPRITAIGDVDELNSVIGVVLSHYVPVRQTDWLYEIQHDLFDLGGELAMPGTELLSTSDVKWLENITQEMNNELPPLKDFVLPGGGMTATFCHLARSVCRRAERSLVRLGRDEEITQTSRQYLNRLSDFLFVLARYLSEDGEVLWRHRNVEI